MQMIFSNWNFFHNKIPLTVSNNVGIELMHFYMNMRKGQLRGSINYNSVQLRLCKISHSQKENKKK